MILLAIDTAATLCAASIHDTGRGELGREVRDLGKGHAEHLMEVIALALERAGVTYRDLGAVAVSVGPGSFTGVRVGVATARGLALALKVPAVGVSTLEALAAEARDGVPERAVLARIDAGRGQAYIASYSAAGAPVLMPAGVTLEEAGRIAGEAGDAVVVEGRTADIAVYARLAAERIASGTAIAPPKPLYLRDADAKPQTAFALPRAAAS